MTSALFSKSRYGIRRNSHFFRSDLFIRITKCYICAAIIILLTQHGAFLHHQYSILARYANSTDHAKEEESAGANLNRTTHEIPPHFMHFTQSLLIASILYVLLVLFLSSLNLCLQFSIWKNSKICLETSRCIAGERYFYFGESSLLVNRRRGKKLSQVQSQDFGIGNSNAVSVTCCQVKCKLEDFVHTRKLNTKYDFYIDAILWLHDLTQTVQYVHENNVYHLNLSISNIYLHWFEDLKTSDKYISFTKTKQRNQIWKLYSWLRKISVEKERIDPEARIVLTDMESAVKSTSGRVSTSACDEMPARCRPPECTNSKEVDAAKIDAWCIGVIAYELLTGGMLHIALMKSAPDVCLHDILKLALKKEYFSTALWTFFQFPQALMWQKLKCAPKYYHLDPSELTNDCWEFVKGLLHPDPNERMELKRALECPLMQKVSRDLNEYHVDSPFIV